MAYPIPAFVFTPDGGVETTLTPTYPPVNKPVIDERRALRHDSFTSSGLRQSMLERVDIIKMVEMQNVPVADASIWAEFIDYAIAGGTFKYFEDSTQTAWATYELVDDNVKPAFASRGLIRVSFSIRKIPGGPSAP